MQYTLCTVAHIRLTVWTTYTSNNIIKPNEYEILITQFGSLLISTRWHIDFANFSFPPCPVQFISFKTELVIIQGTMHLTACFSVPPPFLATAVTYTSKHWTNYGNEFSCTLNIDSNKMHPKSKLYTLHGVALWQISFFFSSNRASLLMAKDFPRI